MNLKIKDYTEKFYELISNLTNEERMILARMHDNNSLCKKDNNIPSKDEVTK